ncbi:MAG: hypothetical protein M1603_00335 [Candidatus Marsarchaeota archaeon]|jgi:hypothetical protein|nr:hypothetical protein [Candidatus Marsarchaeota archaeon]
MKLQAFIDIEVSLAICLLFAVLLSGAYVGMYRSMNSQAQGLASGIVTADRAVSGFIHQYHGA